MNQEKLHQLKKNYENLSDEVEAFRKIHNFIDFKPNVGVFGENSTGKSTFLNTIVGNKEQFKMGFGETTNQVTVLYKQKKPYLSRYVEYNYIQADYKQLEYFNIFDIPGYGKEYSQQNLEIVLSELDIVLWIINPATCIKKSDQDFLQKLTCSNTKIIVIYNRIDSIIHEIDNYEEILSDMKKIKYQLHEYHIDKHLIGIFPYSAIKLLVSIVKEEENIFFNINQILQSVIYYSAFLKSFNRYANYLISDISGYKVKYTKKQIIKKFNKNIEDISKKLERKLKNNVSCWDSLNPFSSKDEESKVYLLNSVNELNKAIQEFNSLNFENFDKKISIFQSNLQEYKVFNQYSLSFPRIIFKDINLHIDLNDLAWDSFWGDSFAEDVVYQFRRRSKMSVENQIDETFINFNKYSSQLIKSLEQAIQLYSRELDQKLQTMSLRIQELISYLIINNLKEEQK